MNPHDRRVRANRPPKQETLTLQILSPKRVRDSRCLNGNKAADAGKKTHYVTTQTSPATCQKSKHPSRNERNKMLCKKYTLYRGELSKAQNNIRLIEYLIEDVGRMEKLQDCLDRLAMLHKPQACTHKLQRCGKSDICHQPLRKSTPLLRSMITRTK